MTDVERLYAEFNQVSFRRDNKKASIRPNPWLSPSGSATSQTLTSLLHFSCRLYFKICISGNKFFSGIFFRKFLEIKPPYRGLLSSTCGEHPNTVTENRICCLHLVVLFSISKGDPNDGGLQPLV